MNIQIANLKFIVERGWTVFEIPSTPRTFLFFLFHHLQYFFGDEISCMHATNHSPSLSIFCRIFGEYLGRRFEVQNRRTRGGLCSVFQITITPRPLLVSKLFIHVQSLSGYETPCMGRRIAHHLPTMATSGGHGSGSPAVPGCRTPGEGLQTSGPSLEE